MTAKEYLSQVLYIDQRINCKLRQVAQLRENATRATATISDMPRPDSPNVKSMENTICKIVDLEQACSKLVDSLMKILVQMQTAVADIFEL